MSDLPAVLARRDARQHRQSLLLAKYPTVLGFTVVSPGPTKSSPRIEAIFAAGLNAVHGVLADREWEFHDSTEIHPETGPEWMAVVDVPAEDLKRVLCQLEDWAPLGRLWDLDVIDRDGPLSRRAIGFPARKCLVCESEAHACARSRAHGLDELEKVIVSMMDE